MATRFWEFFVMTTIYLCLSNQVYSEENPDKNFSNFETSTNICDKCECKTYKKLFVLNCANRDLHNTLSNWPSHQNRTLTATFSHNVITSLEKFPSSNCSAALSLDHCGIKFLAPGLFENMKNVKFVDLSHNLISTEELSSEKFKGPYNKDKFEPIELTHLNLAHNNIHSLRNSIFEHMPRLRHLNLEGNGFKVLDDQTQMAIKSLTNLEHLNLANNGLKQVPDILFAESKKLISLNIAKNLMTSVPYTALPDHLEILILDSNPIYELTDETFGGTPNLMELSLNNLSNLVEIHSDIFTSLTKLNKLHLCNNDVLEIIEPDAFGTHGNIVIKELYMNNNNLLDLPYLLLNWTSLHVFEFNDNPFICSCNLYNISKSLNSHITRNKAGPYCIGENEISRQVFSLDDGVCGNDYETSMSFRREMRVKFSIIRVTLITLTLVAVTAFFIVVVICFAKQRKYDLLGRNLSGSTQILYNPLNRQPSL